MSLPQDLRYTASHEWVRDNGDGTVTVGITDHAQDQLGDVVFVEIQKVGKAVRAGDAVGVVESVKAVSDVYSPLAGTVVEANAELDANYDRINKDPYSGGWMFRLRLDDPGALGGLLDAAAYQASIG